MAKNGFWARHGFVRQYAKEDLFFFAIPGLIVFSFGLILSGRAGFNSSPAIIWNLITQPPNLFTLPMHTILGVALIVAGFSIMIIAHIILRWSHVSTLAIRENHKLRTNWLYRFVRHPLYFGAILIAIGVPVSVASMKGFLVMLLLIPIVLIRIRLEEKMLIEAFGDEYRNYMKTTKKLFPFVY